MARKSAARPPAAPIVEVPVVAPQTYPVPASVDAERVEFAAKMQHIDRRGKIHVVERTVSAPNVQDAVNFALNILRGEFPESTVHTTLSILPVNPPPVVEQEFVPIPEEALTEPVPAPVPEA